MSLLQKRQAVAKPAERGDYSAFFAEVTAEAIRKPNTPLRWSSLRRLVTAWFRDRRQFSVAKLARVCPVCSHKGVFISVGWPSRWDARCPKCGSRERHRLMALWMQANGRPLDGKRILHFAPEKTFRRMLSVHPGYETADLHQAGVTHRLDVTNVTQPDESYDVVVAHHLLEHIEDDRKAMSEFFRILKPGSFAILSVPLNGTRSQSYENPAVQTDRDRLFHYGQGDHKRVYGLDFEDRLREVGFDVELFRAPSDAEVIFSLLPNEWIYIARK